MSVNSNIPEKKHNDGSIESQIKELMGSNPEKLRDLLDKAQSALIKRHGFTRPKEYFASIEIVDNWINNCFDDIRNYVKVISYPLFVYLFIDMIKKGMWSEGKFS